MPARPRQSANPAVRAEPRGIGTARARDPLAREVKLLGALLGQVIVEQEGLAALELVERVRKSTIAIRRRGPDSAAGRAERQRLAAQLEAVDLPTAEVLIRAFSLYFQLTNLAEEKQRIRRRLREEITLLWHASPIRLVAPGPLDEVRSAMAIFDETLFVVTPRLYRVLEEALDQGAAESARRTPVGPFLHW